MKRIGWKGSSCETTFYKSYVDDILAVFEPELDVEAFFTHLNTKHKSIKLTYEKQIENTFLDI